GMVAQSLGMRNVFLLVGFFLFVVTLWTILSPNFPSQLDENMLEMPIAETIAPDTNNKFSFCPKERI
ncbi:Transporter, major facilitator family protein, partial [human gut metagenome]